MAAQRMPLFEKLHLKSTHQLEAKKNNNKVVKIFNYSLKICLFIGLICRKSLALTLNSNSIYVEIMMKRSLPQVGLRALLSCSGCNAQNRNYIIFL